jgi:histidyl-tRNA synthetase
VVGTDSLICEAEIILMINEVFGALRLSDYTIKINHRRILSGLADLSGTRDQETSLFVALDKLDKIGEEKVREELASRGIPKDKIATVFQILGFNGSNVEKLDYLDKQFAVSESGKKGSYDLREILKLLQLLTSSVDHVELDLTLARGLSYYTGTIFEVKINNVAIGSVCGGGRYDNLTGVFGMPDVSGTGISFGVDRIYDALEELALFPKEANTTSKVLVAHMDESTLAYGLGILSMMRQRGIASEIYPDVSKLKKQLDYANRKLIPNVLVIGADEMNTGLLSLKIMESGEQKKLSLDDVLNYPF